MPGIPTPIPARQRGFLDALLRLEVNVDASEVRETYISIVNGGGSNGYYDQSLSSLSPQLCYLLGLLAGRTQPEVLIVSASFDLYKPLRDFVRRGGKAALVFFNRYLDPRWTAARLLDVDSPIKWYDLEPHAAELLGVELPSESNSQPGTHDGLGRI